MASRTRRSAPVRPEKLAADYARYSTVDQGSTAEQQAINEELAAEEGIRIVDRFTDEGLSRSLSDRPGLRSLFAFLEANPDVGYIIVNELERMTAGINQRQEITRICKQLRITILTEDMGLIDPHDEDKMHEADQRAVTAKGEVLKVRRRVRRNLRAKVKAGTTLVLRPPYGIRMKPLVTPDGTVLPSGISMLDGNGKKVTSGEIEKHPDEYPWLVKIFDWAADGVSLQEICRRLMNAGVETKTGKTRWDGTTVRGILDNPLYKGEMSWGLRQTLRDENGRKYYEIREEDDPGRLTFPSPLGPIIDPEVWDRVQKLKETRVRRVDPRKNEPQVFDHRVFCGRCGTKMYGRPDPLRTGGYSWRYTCLTSYGSMSFRPVDGFGPLCTTGHSMALKDILNALAGGSVKVRGGAPVEVTVVPGGAVVTPADRRRSIEAIITTAEERVGRAEDLAIDGMLSKDKLRATQAECEAVIAKARADLEALDADPTSEPEPFVGEYRAQMAAIAERLADTSTPIELRTELLDSAGLDRIYVDNPRLRLHFR